MATPAPRSANAALQTGMVEGTYKRIDRDRGGLVENATWSARRDLAPAFYGLHEAATKETPDGRLTTSLDTVSVPTQVFTV